MEQFTGRLWERFSRELTRYGLGVLRAWIRHGTIYGKAKTLTGYGLGRIEGWPDDQTRFEGQTLFIKGGDSDYMQPQYTETVMAQFPAAKARIIAGTGHWLHAEKPALFNKLVVDFLSTGG